MVGWLNVGSLILGLVAWILPLVALMLYKKEHNKWIIFPIASLSACAVSLCFQIFYNDHLVKIGDWSALMDTTDAVSSAAAVLLIVTILLNVITLIVYRGRLTK
ncbi:hypothetical protein ACA30_18430 [Virgibacillus soli]|uniref:hypothetical protein n=1 Tax=Lederbergia galactosidilytica TaxID=217031 RepID=UPI0007126C6B|nr:hypothetical protein [Lederbergia galactosidilytica]KRG12593.1 hypothetical protein ACA30_18430 [Virgibacillus soli]MBP1916064.1 cytochrome c oxidase subunit 4 [Lederbergia galactosidilytica]